MEKKLYRSRKNKVLCGVCGGLAEYFNIDPTIVRLAAIFLCGASLLTYLICAIVIPEEPDDIVDAA